MGKVRDAAEKLWTGAESTVNFHPLLVFHGLEELDTGLAFVSSLANVTAIDTDDGLVLIDTGSPLTGLSLVSQIARWSPKPVHTAIYTHGHIDHAMGIFAFEKRGPIHVVSHEAVAARFDRYRATVGYNAVINARQFRVPGLTWPSEYRYPDQTYRQSLALDVGGVRFELHHDRGETDDHTWVWLPERKALCTGDLFIWAAPNCGNPQKAQRYAKQWARALDRMAALGAELLLPGHGPPIFGADRVAQALADTAALLHTIHDQTLDLMNQGARLDDILQAVAIPENLLDRPYLRPVYDDPMFIVRNVWRGYGGWYDGNPARLEPAPDARLSAEVADLAGGASNLARRALAAANRGDLALACQLAEWAFGADADARDVRDARAEIYRRRAEQARSLMARSIYTEAANDSAS